MIIHQDIGIEQLQIAIFEALSTTGFEVYQYVPKDAPYPFIHMGEEYISPNHTKTKAHFEVFHVIHAFSKSTNKREINRMNRAIVLALSTRLELAEGFYISDFRLDNGITVLDPEEQGLFHSTYRFYYRISKE